MEKIISYITGKYKPDTVIIYGSYADGTNNEDSDFDALVVTENGEELHDNSLVDGVRLDVFVYPASAFEGNFDYDDIIQINGGRLLLDKNGAGKSLLEKVKNYLGNIPQKTREEKQSDVDWCGKMLLRAERGGAEGNFRRHRLITDSLEIWCGLIGRYYDGPKKSLGYMEKNFPETFEKYSAVLSGTDTGALGKWVSYLASLI